MNEPRVVGVFGGSFNPPHVGHVLASVYALSTAPIDEVLVKRFVRKEAGQTH